MRPITITNAQTISVMETCNATGKTDPCQQAFVSPWGEECPEAERPKRKAVNAAETEADEIHLFSYFKKPIRNTRPEARVGLKLVHELIRGDAFKEATQTLREIGDEGVARNYKAEYFDYVTFSGVFSRRDRKCLEQHSGLLCIDFDHVGDPEQLEGALLKDAFLETALSFISPSGKGLKWVVPIDLSAASHEKWFTAIRNYLEQTYRVKVDASGRDVSRACFLPHDADAYLNPKYR